MTHMDCTAAVASGDTVETLIGTIRTSARCKRITGVWSQVFGGALLTTAEAISGIVRLDSPDLPLAPFKMPTDQVSTLTSGAVALPTHIIPVDIPCDGARDVTGYVTLDDAETGAITARFGIVYED